jgi:hypothetical protein
MCFESFETPAQCDGDTAPGASPDLRMRLCLGYNEDCTVKDDHVSDANLDTLYAFLPKELHAVDPATPVGALSGRIDQVVTLGLQDSSCSNSLQISFTLLNASVDAGKTIGSLPPGLVDPLAPLAEDVSPANGIPDGADRYPVFLNYVLDPDFDPGPDSIPGTADDVNGPHLPAVPSERLFGATRIQGVWMPYNLLVLEPGATIRGPEGSFLTLNAGLGRPLLFVLSDPMRTDWLGAISDRCTPFLSSFVLFGLTRDNPCTGPISGHVACPGSPIVDNRGYPLLPCELGNTADEDADGYVNDGCPQVRDSAESGTQCDNTTSDDPEDTAINDGCPAIGPDSEAEYLPGAEPCSGSNEAGCIQLKNPSADTYFSSAWNLSERDADGDGIANELDVCWDRPNPAWDPRGPQPGPEDADGDGLPAACDPDDATQSPPASQLCPEGFTGVDEDGDCKANRLDNCPLVNQLSDPSRLPGVDNLPFQRDGDRDGIGDACDPRPGFADGAYVSNCLTFALAVGSPGGPALGALTNDPNCSLGVAVLPAGIGPAAGAAATSTATPTVGAPAPTPAALPAAGQSSGGPGDRSVPIVVLALIGVLGAGSALGSVAWLRRRQLM